MNEATKKTVELISETLGITEEQTIELAVNAFAMFGVMDALSGRGLDYEAISRVVDMASHGGSVSEAVQDQVSACVSVLIDMGY